jgi:DDE superfamily endonuclease
MHSLPRGMAAVLNSFSRLFTVPTWAHVQVLLMGAILCQGARRVSSILRVMGLSKEKRFEKYHRVLSRAKWNSMTGAKILLGLLVQLLPASFPILIVVDDTIERRSGKKIKAKGCYRDACRSTEKLVVKCFGLKWVCLMLIVPLPWCKRRPSALPFMTILAPSKKANKAAGKAHKTSIDWTIVAICVIARWLRRAFILIGDGGFACIRLGHACTKNKVTLVSRLRLDVALYEVAPTPAKGQLGRRREKGERVSSLKELANDMTQLWRDAIVTWYGGESKQVRILSGINLWYTSGEKPLLVRWVLVLDVEENQTEAFYSTDIKLEPEQIVNWFVLRWNIEVTFFETRAHLGFVRGIFGQPGILMTPGLRVSM